MAKADALDKVEEVLEVIDDAIEPSRVVGVLRGRKFQLILVAVLAGSAAGGATYLLTRHRLKAYYESIADEEIAEAREAYRRLGKADEFDSPEKAVAALISNDEGYSSDVTNGLNVVEEGKGLTVGDAPVEPTKYHTPPPKSEGPAQSKNEAAKELAEEIAEDAQELAETVGSQPRERNVFRDSKSANSVFDVDAERAQRQSDRPYVITQQEFMENEDDFQQTTLTYYAGDQVLADENDQVILDNEKVIGEDNLRFGHGSDDARTVHVRNEKIQIDFEILKSDGSYSREVLDLDDAGQPSHRQWDDDGG